MRNFSRQQKSEEGGPGSQLDKQQKISLVTMSLDRFISTLLYITWMDENPLYIQDSGAFTGTRLKLANKCISLKSGTVFPQELRRQVRLQKVRLMFQIHALCLNSASKHILPILARSVQLESRPTTS